jgi:hypothetical protein
MEDLSQDELLGESRSSSQAPPNTAAEAIDADEDVTFIRLVSGKESAQAAHDSDTRNRRSERRPLASLADRTVFLHGAEQVAYNKNKASKISEALASFLKANNLWEDSLQMRLPDSEGLCVIAFRTVAKAEGLLRLKKVRTHGIDISFSRNKPPVVSVMIYQLPLDTWPQTLRDELKPFRPTYVEIKKDNGFFIDIAVVKFTCETSQLPEKFIIAGKKCPMRILKDRPPIATTPQQQPPPPPPRNTNKAPSWMPKPQAQARTSRENTAKGNEQGRKGRNKAVEQVSDESRPSSSKPDSRPRYFAPPPPPDLQPKPNTPPRTSPKQKKPRTNPDTAPARDGVFFKPLPIPRGKEPAQDASSEAESSGSVNTDSSKSEAQPNQQSRRARASTQGRTQRNRPQGRTNTASSRASRKMTDFLVAQPTNSLPSGKYSSFVNSQSSHSESEPESTSMYDLFANILD